MVSSASLLLSEYFDLTPKNIVSLHHETVIGDCVDASFGLHLFEGLLSKMAMIVTLVN